MFEALAIFVPSPTTAGAILLDKGITLGAIAFVPNGFQLGAQFLGFANDPPDPNFTTIAQPTISSLAGQPFTANDAGTQQLADAINALLTNQQQSIGIGTALQTSLNRADGALTAGNLLLENQQVQAAQGYSLQLGGLIGAQPDLYADLASAYSSILGSSSLEITASDILTYQNSLRANGLPPQLSQALTALGSDNAAQDQILQSILALDPNQVSTFGGGKFPNIFIDPSFIASLNNASQAFKQGVIGGVGNGNTGATAVPTPALFPGLISIGIAAFRKKRKSEAAAKA